MRPTSPTTSLRFYLRLARLPIEAESAPEQFVKPRYTMTLCELSQFTPVHVPEHGSLERFQVAVFPVPFSPTRMSTSALNWDVGITLSAVRINDSTVITAAAQLMAPWSRHEACRIGSTRTCGRLAIPGSQAGKDPA